MSFSSNVKAELCKDSMGRKSCAVAESYGVLLYCNTFTSASSPKVVILPRVFQSFSKGRSAFRLTLSPRRRTGGSFSLRSRRRTKLRKFLIRCKWTSNPA